MTTKTISFDVSFPDDMTPEEVSQALKEQIVLGRSKLAGAIKDEKAKRFLQVTIAPTKEDIFSLLERIEAATIKDLEHKTPQDLFVSTASELGELATEMLIEQQVHGHKNKMPDEGVSGESVDLTICALALYYSTGGTNENFIKYAHKKIAKWEQKK
jgi:hypothetical protein